MLLQVYHDSFLIRVETADRFTERPECACASDEEDESADPKILGFLGFINRDVESVYPCLPIFGKDVVHLLAVKSRVSFAHVFVRVVEQVEAALQFDEGCVNATVSQAKHLVIVNAEVANFPLYEALERP